MSEAQMHNFCTRSHGLLRRTNYPNFFKLALDLTAPDIQERKKAVGICRLAQVASGVHWGGTGTGLRHVLWTNPQVSQVAKFAPKFAALCQNILEPSSRNARLEARRTRHFVYSISQSTISHLAETLKRVADAGGKKLFRELLADELEWVDSTHREVKLKSPLTSCASGDGGLMFVIIHGSSSRDDRTKLKAAFGFVTPDGRRYEGLRHKNGAPVVHVLLGSHETNQVIFYPWRM